MKYSRLDGTGWFQIVEAERDYELVNRDETKAWECTGISEYQRIVSCESDWGR